jgi:hypothetical protein
MGLLNKPLQLATIVILAVVGSLYWYAGKQQQRYDAAATQFLTQALADIARWEPEALRRQLSDEALSAIDDAQLVALTDRYRSLGAFKRIDEMQFTRLTAALRISIAAAPRLPQRWSCAMGNFVYTTSVSPIRNCMTAIDVRFVN